MKPYIHTKSYGPFRGLDLSKSPQRLAGQPNYLRTFKNGEFLTGTSAIGTRRGFTHAGGSRNRTGLPGSIHRFVDVNTDTGASTETLLGVDYVDGRLFKLVYTPISFLTTDPSTWAVNFFVTAAGIPTLTITKNGAVLLTYATQTTSGVVNTLKTIDSLVSYVNGDATMIANGVSCIRTSGDGTAIASESIPITYNKIFGNGNNVIITAESWTQVDVYVAENNGWADLAGTQAAEFLASAQIQNVLYFSAPNSHMLKWDGQNLYRAGLPPAAGFTSIVAAAGSNVANGYYSHAIAYEQTDAKGNVIEGLGGCLKTTSAAAPDSVQVSGGPKSLTLTMKPLTSSDYNTNYGMSASSQNLAPSGSTCTFNVDDGGGGPHTLRVGDSACFRLTVTGNAGTSNTNEILVQAKITAVPTSTSITIDSSNVTVTHLKKAPEYAISFLTPTTANFVSRFTPESGINLLTIKNSGYGVGATSATLNLANDAPISNGLLINIYRNKGAGLAGALTAFPTFYLCDIVPNNSSNATQTFTDDVPDLSLGDSWVQKINLSASAFPTDFGLPPKGRYVTAHKGRLYVGDKNTLYRSDILNGPEWFDPTGTSNLDVSTVKGDQISGLLGLGNRFIVGKDSSTVLISGDLSSETNIVVEPISNELGCAAHATMVTLNGRAVWLSRLGPVVYSSGATGLSFLGSPVDVPKSRIEAAVTAATADLKRAVATVDARRGAYCVFIPTSSQQNLGYQAYTNATVASANPLDGTAGSIYVFDLLNDAWFQWTNCMALGGLQFLNNRLYYLSTHWVASTLRYRGSLMRENASSSIYDYVDEESGIAFEVSTSFESLGEPNIYKWPVRVALVNEENDDVAASGNSPTLNVSSYINNDTSTVSTSASIVLAARNGSTAHEEQVKLTTQKSKSISIVVGATALNQRATISGFDLEVAAPFRPKSKGA